MAGVNPFRPKQPIDPTLFVGRTDEISRLAKALLQTRAGNPANFLVTGRRGIGKSSLLRYIKALAQGDVRVEGMPPVKFLVVDIDIDSGTTQLGLVEKINLGLEHALSKSEEMKAFLSKAWGFLSQLEVAGVKLNTKESTRDGGERIMEAFAYSLADTVIRVTDPNVGGLLNATYDGVLLLIDECDQASRQLSLGSLLKNLTERLTRRGCDRLLVGLGGLPNLREVLRDSHESSLRIFDELWLEALTTDEVVDLVEMCLERAEKDNGVVYKIDGEALDLLISLAGGVPHYMQAFGSSAFDADTDNVISFDDVFDGANEEHGAVAQLGYRYFESWYTSRLGGADREVVDVLARAHHLEYVPRTVIATGLPHMDAVDIGSALERLQADDTVECGEIGEIVGYRIKEPARWMWLAHKGPGGPTDSQGAR